MRVITITTDDYALNTVRLIKSLKRFHSDCEIAVYSESASLEAFATHYDVKLHILPEIKALGVKRAKFSAYAHAAKNGGFIYLDSDIVVLQTLVDLRNVRHFTACRDDLSECPFIHNKHQPWENYQQWSADKYFNSGVFAVPTGFQDFFDMIGKEALDDADWDSIVIPGKLYDNHYLCAKTAKYCIDLHFVSEYEYNWQGFRRNNLLNCYVDQSSMLRNTSEGSLLRLVHFAGIRDIDTFLANLPIEISTIVAAAVDAGPNGALELINAASSYIWGNDGNFKQPLLSAICSVPSVDIYSPGEDKPLLSNAASIASVVHSTVASDFLWNGLVCGASYLSAREYKALRDFVQQQEIERILEFGAGYTSALFAKFARKHVAVEGWVGPWADFARSSGCDVRIIGFSTQTGFDEEQLDAAIGDVLSENARSMIFIDSPPGTTNRSLVVEQILQRAPKADYYVIHDSVRDAEIVYRLAQVLELTVVRNFSSWRGLTFLGRESGRAPEVMTSEVNVASCRAIKFAATLISTDLSSRGVLRAFVEIQNHGDTLLPLRGANRLLFSMHILSAAGDIISWDTPRYSLPVDLEPGDVVSFWVNIPLEYGPSIVLACDFVKEGEFWLSDIASAACPKIILNCHLCE